jgi:hypothetical protein
MPVDRPCPAVFLSGHDGVENQNRQPSQVCLFKMQLGARGLPIPFIRRTSGRTRADKRCRLHTALARCRKQNPFREMEQHGSAHRAPCESRACPAMAPVRGDRSGELGAALGTPWFPPAPCLLADLAPNLGAKLGYSPGLQERLPGPRRQGGEAPTSITEPRLTLRPTGS